MKKSLQVVAIGLSILTLSCHKSSVQSDVMTSDPVKTSNQRGADVGQSDGGVTFQCTSCLMTYPDNSNLPKSGAAFNESDVLVASEPGQLTCGINSQFIKVWYSDEHALTLGVRQVNIISKVNGKTVTSTTNYGITIPAKSPAIANDPQIGTTDQSGDYTGNDEAVGGGRPLWPALFITDITKDPNSRSGDWQQGGTAYPPNKVCGAWKAAVKTIDKTRPVTDQNYLTITPDADPAKNNWDLAGGDLPPTQPNSEGYTAEVAWDVNKLISLGVLQSGHIYRLQFMVHDGDQNKVGGDVGESCTTIYIPNGFGHQPD